MTDLIDDVPTDCYIGGEWRKASDGDTFEVDDPETGKVIATVANGSVDDGRTAVAAAHDAFASWAATPPRQRAEMLRRAFELMTERAAEIAEPIVR